MGLSGKGRRMTGPVPPTACWLPTPTHLPTGPAPSLQQRSSLVRLPRAAVCGQAQLGTFAYPPLTFPTLYPLQHYVPAHPPSLSASDAVCLLWAFTLLFSLPGFLCLQFFLWLTRSHPKEICLRVTSSEAPSLTTLSKVDIILRLSALL